MSVESVLLQLQFAREYTATLLADVAEDEWFVMPPGAPTHLAWQVGHIAMAEYGLCLFRQRGRQPVDLDLMSSPFRKLFARGSTPEKDPAKYPSIAEIRATLDRVHRQVLEEAPTFSAESFAEPCDPPTVGSPTKMGAFLLAPMHEMLHAGQIGLLRRLLGKSPVR